jgi:uncharacterized protein (TIGR02246 family)
MALTRTLLLLLFSSVFLLPPVMTCAQAASKRSTSAKELEIRELDKQAARAVLEKDANAIARFFTKDSVTNNPRNSLTLGSDGVIEAARAGIIDYYTFERVVESVQIRGNTAIVMGNETVVMKSREGGAGNTIRRRYTNVWMKTGKSWQIVARHANVICPGS